MKFNKTVLAGAILMLLAASAYAQSPLGIGASEPVTTPTGLFSNLLATINQYQREFYQAMTGALADMRENPSQLWLLVSLSFAYGIFHAAGPGHGKAVISSYMIANEVELRRGVVLSFMSAFMQGAMALAVVAAVYFILRGTSISMGQATFSMEVASYILIIAFGLWLLWQKLKAYFKPVGDVHIHKHAPENHAHDHGHNHVHTAECGHQHNHSDSCTHHKDHDHHHEEHRHPVASEVCPSCGHAHMPDPKTLSGPFSLGKAWSAVVAVGIRPCSGAVIVLSFALVHQLYLGGVLAVLAMSLGTAITVSILATLAVSAKNLALKLSSSNSSAVQIGTIIEVFGALLVILLGIMLLTAALY